MPEIISIVANRQTLIDNCTLDELKAYIISEKAQSFAEGYKICQQELEAAKADKKFGEIIKGYKELHSYLIYKGWYHGEVKTFEKTNYKELADNPDAKRLIFRRGCVDHEFTKPEPFILVRRFTNKHKQKAERLEI